MSTASGWRWGRADGSESFRTPYKRCGNEYATHDEGEAGTVEYAHLVLRARPASSEVEIVPPVTRASVAERLLVAVLDTVAYRGFEFPTIMSRLEACARRSGTDVAALERDVRALAPELAAVPGRPVAIPTSVEPTVVDDACLEECCAVCLDDFAQPDGTNQRGFGCGQNLAAIHPCRHIFHGACIRAWLAPGAGTGCPICRGTAAATELGTVVRKIK